MNVRAALTSQYRAALKVLRDVIEKCPEELWYRPADGLAPVWRVVYHTLYFTNLYLHQRQEDFTPWARHQEEANYIASVPRENHRPPRPCEPYGRGDLLEYWQRCFDAVAARVEALDLTAEQCGFPWYQMSTLEHQLLNLRHIQHHAAILSFRTRQAGGGEVKWVGKG